MDDLATNSGNSNVTVSGQLDLEASTMREIGDNACWSISSAKAGNGIEQIRDNNIETYWQSGIFGLMYDVHFMI